MKAAQKVILAVVVTLMTALSVSAQIEITPENRCSPYNRSDYYYPASIELRIISENLDGKIVSPYTGEVFRSRTETDIEHIVAASEAHDSGLCDEPRSVKRQFAQDLENLTLASPTVNRHQKSDKDFAEWVPAENVCWFAQTIVKVKAKYGLSVDTREAVALLDVLRRCQPNHECLSASESDRGAILNCYAGSEVSLSAEADPAETEVPGCFPSDTAYVSAGMNIREEASVSSEKLGVAPAGTYDVEGSVQGDTYCWINIGDGWIAHTARVSDTKPAPAPVSRTVSRSTSQSGSQPTTTRQQSAPSVQEPAPQPVTQNALALYDDNRNGRITCAEARNHGIAPVPRGHPAYPYMDDRDNDGVVCE